MESVSGTISAVMLFGKLQEYNKPKNILVIDDSDATLEDTECLEVLKAAKRLVQEVGMCLALRIIE